jgi:hypothetical protein
VQYRLRSKEKKDGHRTGARNEERRQGLGTVDNGAADVGAASVVSQQCSALFSSAEVCQWLVWFE